MRPSVTSSNSSPPDRDAKSCLDELTRAFFQAFSPGPDGRVDLGELRRLFVPQGVLIKTCGPVPEISDLEGFIEPREKLLNGGALTGFREEELQERTEVFGNVAQRFLLYRKRGVLDGKPFETRGVKTIQFIRTPDGWKMSALAWDDERAGLTIPAGWKL